MILAPTYLFTAAIATTIVADGGPGWLNLMALAGIWNAAKFAWMAAMTPFLIVASVRRRRAPA